MDNRFYNEVGLMNVYVKYNKDKPFIETLTYSFDQFKQNFKLLHKNIMYRNMKDRFSTSANQIYYKIGRLKNDETDYLIVDEQQISSYMIIIIEDDIYYRPFQILKSILEASYFNFYKLPMEVHEKLKEKYNQELLQYINIGISDIQNEHIFNTKKNFFVQQEGLLIKYRKVISLNQFTHFRQLYSKNTIYDIIDKQTGLMNTRKEIVYPKIYNQLRPIQQQITDKDYIKFMKFNGKSPRFYDHINEYEWLFQVDKYGAIKSQPTNKLSLDEIVKMKNLGD